MIWNIIPWSQNYSKSFFCCEIVRKSYQKKESAKKKPSNKITIKKGQKSEISDIPWSQKYPKSLFGYETVRGSYKKKSQPKTTPRKTKPKKKKKKPKTPN